MSTGFLESCADAVFAVLYMQLFGAIKTKFPAPTRAQLSVAFEKRKRMR
jgi:hypothetical protein